MIRVQCLLKHAPTLKLYVDYFILNNYGIFIESYS